MDYQQKNYFKFDYKKSVQTCYLYIKKKLLICLFLNNCCIFQTE